MEVRAISKDTGIPVRKVRPLVNMIRGKKVDQALTLLQLMPTPKAKILAKAVKSAVANAENNFQMNPAELRIVSVFADEARGMRRYRPQPRGRASSIQRRSSHITVIVNEEEG